MTSIEMREWGVLVLLSLGIMLAGLSLASAQTVANPTRAEFTPSPDHAVTMPDGTAVVTRYEIRYTAAGASAPVQVGDLGKPTPDPVTGVITSDITGGIGALPISFTTIYTATVAAMGPTGEGVSTPSNPFYRAGSPTAPPGAVVLSRP